MTSSFDAKRGAAARDRSTAQVADAASATWLLRAWDAVRYVAERKPEFTTDAVWYVLEVEWQVSSPREPRALGPVMLAVVKDRVCVPTDRTHRSVRAACHCRRLMVYKSLLFQGDKKEGA